MSSSSRGYRTAFANTLTKTISDTAAASWRKGEVPDWADEDYAVAKRVVYGELPHEAGGLPASYSAKALPVVEQQLEKAGVRLAAVLNSVL